MSVYAYRGRPPRTLTDAEQEKILRVTGEHVHGERDHLIVALALGAGLREHEIAALDVADVIAHALEEPGRGRQTKIRRRVQLRVWKGHRRARRAHTETVVLTDELRRKLERYVSRRFVARVAGAKPTLLITQPLFPSRERERISTRQIRTLWQRWQVRAGFERSFKFHELRHTYVSAVVAAAPADAGGGGLLVAQRLARHRRVETTLVYAHVSDELTERVARKLRS